MKKLIKETDGWKFYKDEEQKHFVIQSPEGFEKINESYSEKNFDDIVRRGWMWIDVEYFTGEIVDSEIKIKKNKKQIQSNKHDLFVLSHFLTKAALIEKYNPVLIKAKEKFEKCYNALIELQKELDFGIGYMMFGDTHGIYEDYSYIDFTMNGVNCHFRIEI